MWRRLAAVMRFEGFDAGASLRKPNPLTARATVSGSPLEEIVFDPNPGNLRMFGYAPKNVKPGAALVVILHGCGQTAAGYDLGTGWSTLAQQEGFALLAPEQKAANNPGTCFNWFTPGDTARGEGEAASIAAMIDTMIAAHGLDPSRVFITGLSAGGAMTAAMLAGYPDRFAAGAIIAGLPFGGAHTVMEALDAMRSPPAKAPREWGALVRAASPATHREWPRIAIWHGDADTTVHVDNAKALTAQWRDVMDLKVADAMQDTIDGATRLAWGAKLEVVTVPGLAHGTPIDSSDLGTPLPFILDAGISSTRRIAQFFGLIAIAATAQKPRAKPRPVQTPQSSVLQTIETTLAANLPSAPAMESLLRRALKRVWKR